MITEDQLRQLIEDLMPKETNTPFVVYAGKSFVRDFAKQFYGGSYTFGQLLGLFRSGIVKGGNGSYIIN
jgi:hypothetical protein